MQHSNILIVGGGPAGSSLAWALRHSGLTVRILDKQSFPRDKTCAGWVTPEVLATLDIDPIQYASQALLQPISAFRVALMNQPPVVTRYGPERSVVSYGVRRCEFDHYLLQRCGADLETGVSLETVERKDGHWLVNGSFSADLLVGAGGHFCPVARLLGAKLGQEERVVVAKEVEFEMSPAQRDECRVEPDVPELYFCEDLKGYSWVFRKGNFLNIGLGREDNQRLSDHLASFVQMLQKRGRIPGDLPKRFKGHAYILYDHGKRQMAGDGLLLIGDALGLAYAQSGEGIRPAVESAMLAAEVIQAAQGDYRESRLKDYEAQILQRFGKRDKDRLIQLSVPPVVKQYAARALLRSEWFARNVIADRWFLHCHQTPLTPLVAGV